MKSDKRSEKRRRILTAADQLFKEKGYLSTKMIDIANASGVAKGTLYEYFESKEDLLMEWMEYTVESMSMHLDGVMDMDVCPREKLKAFIEMKLCASESSIVAVKAMIIASLFGDTQIDAGISEKIGRSFDNETYKLKRLISEGKKTGDFSPDVDETFVVTELMGVLAVIVMFKVMPPYDGLSEDDKRIQERCQAQHPEQIRSLKEIEEKAKDWDSQDVYKFIMQGIGC